MPTHVVDGQDVLAVYRTCTEAYAYARSGRGPVLIEAMTYRLDDESHETFAARRGELVPDA